MENLPEKIPLFPLPGALLLPNSRLPLNIFEPRYINMVEDTIATKHRLIGMIQPTKINTGKNLSGTNRYQKVGCAGRIVSFTETDDGRYLITLEGVSRFKFKKRLKLKSLIFYLILIGVFTKMTSFRSKVLTVSTGMVFWKF